MKATNFKTAILVILMAITLPASAGTLSTDPVTTNPTVMTDARGDELIGRLNEIKNMDKSELTRADKKALRKEVKAIKGELMASGRGVYLSIGAIIIIILLLILIL